MKKPKFTKEEEMKLDILRQSIDRYQNLLQWQKLRRAEKKLLELRLRYDYRSYRRELMLDKYLVTLRPYAKKRRTNFPDERD
tara:strand:- start:200 stop:445 length:246 start_codon:yes stop_codon:yes gene_type:complete